MEARHSASKGNQFKDPESIRKGVLQVATAVEQAQKFSGSSPWNNFVASCAQIWRFYNWVLYMATELDRLYNASRELLKAHDNVEKLGNPDWVDRDPSEYEEAHQMIEEFRSNRQFLMEVILVRHIENFLNYLSQLQHEILCAKPETMRSSEMIDLAFVLSHDSIDDLVRSLAERKMDSLSYGSFEAMREYFGDRFGLEIGTADESKVITEAIETRNISVHNRCIVNKRYLARTMPSDRRVGELRALHGSDFFQLVPLLLRTAQALDEKAVSKFGLSLVPAERQDVG